MKRPLLWAAMALAGGIFAGAQGWVPGFWGPVLLLLLSPLAWLLPRRMPYADAAMPMAAFLALGAVLWQVRGEHRGDDALSRYSLAHPQAMHVLEGHVRQPGVHLPGWGAVRFVLDVDRIGEGAMAHPMQGRVQVWWGRPEFPLYSGDRVRVRGTLSHRLGPVNHGLRDIEDTLRARGVHGALRMGRTAPEKIGVNRWSPSYWASRLRQWEAEGLARAVPRDALPFVLTIWLGERQYIRPEHYESFVASGTAHILAVSGVHVGIVFLILHFLARRAIPSRRLGSVLVIAGVFLFALTAGARASVLRAAIMVAVYLAADCFDREPDVPNALGVAAMILLALQPAHLFDPGFVLSFASVASILVFADLFRAGLAWAPWWLRGGASATLAVQALPLPLVARYFYVFPLAAPLINLIMVPLLSIALWLSLVTTVCAAVFPPAALLFGHALQPVAGAAYFLAERFAAIPGTYMHLAAPRSAAVAAYWAALIAGYAAWKAEPVRRRRMLGAAVILLAATCVCWRPWTQPDAVDFLDVGHSDAALVRTAAGDAVLIDGGDMSEVNDTGARVVLPFLRHHGVRRLDYVVVTHADRDHIGGLFHVLRRMPVGAVLLGPEPDDRPLKAEFLALCAARGVPVHRVARGDVIPLRGGALEVLHPPRGWRPDASPNDASLVLRLRWAGPDVVFAGDVEADGERVLATQDCRAEILKVPHHGSATSSTAAFLDAVSPAHAVVSTAQTARLEAVGRGVLEHYAARGISVWRTDHHGGVRLERRRDDWTLRGARLERGYRMTQEMAVFRPAYSQ